jgi:hypothetical protein
LKFGGKIIFWPVLAIILIAVPGIVGSAYSQTGNDTVISLPKPPPSSHPPRKATLLAAVIPGAGQAYNRKYWKIPIVYVGLSAAGYMLYTNQKNYKDSKTNYLALTDDDESTVNQSTKSQQELKSDIDGYRRYRDLSVLALLAWHGLTIIDANVDAHFFNWDVSEDLSLKIRPQAMWIGGLKPGIGMSLTLNKK